MVLEDFTTFTKVDDPNNRIIATATDVDFINYDAEAGYLYKDYGTGFFSDFTHMVDLKVIGGIGGGVYSFCAIWACANDLGSMIAMIGNNYFEVVVQWGPGYQFIQISEYNSGHEYIGNQFTYTVNTWYYLKIVKSGTSLKVYIYSDSARTVLLGTLSITLHADYTTRYLYAAQSSFEPFVEGSWMESYVDNLDIGMGPGAYLLFRTS